MGKGNACRAVDKNASLIVFWHGLAQPRP